MIFHLVVGWYDIDWRRKFCTPLFFLPTCIPYYICLCICILLSVSLGRSTSSYGMRLLKYRCWWFACFFLFVIFFFFYIVFLNLLLVFVGILKRDSKQTIDCFFLYFFTIPFEFTYVQLSRIDLLIDLQLYH